MKRMREIIHVGYPRSPRNQQMDTSVLQALNFYWFQNVFVVVTSKVIEELHSVGAFGDALLSPLRCFSEGCLILAET